MAFRPGTITFAIADDSATVRIVYLDRAKPEYSRMPLGKRLAQTVISPDGKLVATRRDESKEAEIWDVETGKSRVRVAHDDVPSDIDFTADGRRLLTRGEDKTTRLWDTRTGSELLQFAPTESNEWFAFSMDGKRMVILRPRRSQDQEAQFEFHDTDSGTVVGKPIPIKEFINIIALSPDGKLLATAEGREGRKEENGGADSPVKMGFFGARLWDTHTWQEVARLPHSYPVVGVAFSPDGKLIATRTNLNVDPIRLWSIPAGKLVDQLGPCRCRRKVGGRRLSVPKISVSTAACSPRALVMSSVPTVGCSPRAPAMSLASGAPPTMPAWVFSRIRNRLTHSPSAATAGCSPPRPVTRVWCGIWPQVARLSACQAWSPFNSPPTASALLPCIGTTRSGCGSLMPMI